MEMLHTPEEIVMLSNAAHIAEGILLLVLAGILTAQAFGKLQKSWQRYLLPGIGLLASLTLGGFLFFDHAGELVKAWRAINADMQQKQHLYMGTLIGLGSVAEFFAIKRKLKLLHLAFPVAVAIIGILFLVHPQHGTTELAERALLIHRIVGSALIAGALAKAVSVFYPKLQKVLLLITALAFAVSGGLFIAYREPPMDMSNGGAPVQSHRTYSLKALADKDYMPNQPTEYSFQIIDERGQILKDFDIVHEKQMHFIAVRKDATNFQHVHPSFDKASGTFSLSDLTFPTDGVYRLFADFTPSDAQMGPSGSKLPATPYQDVYIGDISKYKPEPLGAQRFKSQANSFNIDVFLAPHDPNDLGLVAGTSSSFAVGVYKDGQEYRSLENYLGSKGHMVIFGPDLEFIHAHTTTDSTSDSYIVTFSVDFPKGGQYKAFLQTQAEGKINTTDYVLSVKDAPKTQISPPVPSPGHNRH